MKHLPTADFGKAMPLIDSSPSQGCVAFIHSVLQGRMPGHVIVDDENAPEAVIVQAQNTAYLFTAPDFPGIRPLVLAFLQDGLSDEGATLWATSPEQVTALREMVSLETKRISFTFSGLPESLSSLPETGPADGVTLETSLDKGGATPESEVTNLGVRLMRAGEIISRCHSNLLAGGEAEIQIWTHSDHRRKGWATQAVRRFIHEARTHDFRPAWSCDAENTASHNLALQLGFVPHTELHGFYLHPAFLTWRHAEDKIGPLPQASTDGFEEEAVVTIADQVISSLLDASTASAPPTQILVRPTPDSIVAVLIQGDSRTTIRIFPKERLAPLTAQFKARADMHANRQGFPQRGRFAVPHGTTEATVRLQVSPSPHGEQMLFSLVEVAATS